jgi:hypothetical protein
MLENVKNFWTARETEQTLLKLLGEVKETIGKQSTVSVLLVLGVRQRLK